jgi:hypothetical protein
MAYWVRQCAVTHCRHAHTGRIWVVTVAYWVCQYAGTTQVKYKDMGTEGLEIEMTFGSTFMWSDTKGRHTTMWTGHLGSECSILGTPVWGSTRRTHAPGVNIHVMEMAYWVRQSEQ